MKKTLQSLFLTVCLIITVGAIAQPTITANGGIPVIGDKYLVQAAYSGASCAPTTSGANQVWDYSNLIDSGAISTLSMVAPTGLPGASKFPSATIAWHDPSDGSYVFCNNTINTTLGEMGVYTTATNWGVFTPKITRLFFPMAYGNKITDTALFSAAISAGFDGKVTDTLFADGYGTLKLPHNATYNNILRIKIKLTFSFYLSGTFVYSYTSEYYEFVQEGIHYPILLLNSAANSNWSAQYYGGIPVPLLISNFNSSWKNNLPSLQWDASNTDNTKQFNVERSFDGKTFDNLGSVSVTGNSTYQFTDKGYQSGTVYYRLQQLDKDGSIFYSDISKLQSLETNTLSLWPNPTTDKVHLSLVSGSQYQVVIYDFTGKVVYENKSFTPNETIITDKWSKGIYIVKLKDKEGWQTKSFEKL